MSKNGGLKGPMFEPRTEYNRAEVINAVDRVMADPMSLHPSDARDLIWNMWVYILALETSLTRDDLSSFDLLP